MIAIRLAAGAVLVLALAGYLLPLRGPPDWPAALRIDPVWMVSLVLAALCLFGGRPGPGCGALAAALVALQLPVLASLLPGARLAAGWQLAPLLALGFISLGLALLLQRQQAQGRADATLFMGGLALALAALLVFAQMFGAAPLLQAPGGAVPASPSETVLFAVLALAALDLHPASPYQALRGAGAGAHSRRQLLPAALLVPLLVGLLLLAALQRTALDQASAVTLSVMANLLMMLLVIGISGRQIDRMDRRRQAKQAAREQRVRRQGQRDGVTRLLNRRGWEAELKDAESRCRRQKLDACVVIIDLDGLKRINDTQGHEAGDEFIRRAAAALRQAGRRRDILARLGGDEFACLAVGCDAAGAQALSQRLRAALDAAQVPASLGHALRGDGRLERAVRAADAAMYQDKRARGGGRDK